MGNRPIAYVCMPTKTSEKQEEGYYRQIFDAGYTPFSPDTIPNEILNAPIFRERTNSVACISNALISLCHYLVVCGNGVTSEMKQEIRLAKQCGVTIYMLEKLPTRPPVDPVLSVYIVNAEHFQNGEVTGKWHHFPTVAEIFRETLAVIGVTSSDHHGYIVEDYQSKTPALQKLPAGANAEELNYLAAKLESFDDYQMELFGAALLAGKHKGSMRGAITIAVTIDLAGYQPYSTPEEIINAYLGIDIAEYLEVAHG